MAGIQIELCQAANTFYAERRLSNRNERGNSSARHLHDELIAKRLDAHIHFRRFRFIHPDEFLPFSLAHRHRRMLRRQRFFLRRLGDQAEESECGSFDLLGLRFMFGIAKNQVGDLSFFVPYKFEMAVKFLNEKLRL